MTIENVKQAVLDRCIRQLTAIGAKFCHCH